MRIFHPEYFQGDLAKRGYFEGWYFKHVSADGAHVIAIIPGVALTEKMPHGFIQILDGITGTTEYISYPLEQCDLSSRRFSVRIGASTFSAAGAELNIDTPSFRVTGAIHYDDMVRYPVTLTAPGIMGWYAYVPKMECKHAVISMRHRLRGSLRLNDERIDFSNGTGYIEKDWGTSFPECWIWAQGNTFTDSDASFMFSVAKIPWRGRFFIGFLSTLYYHGTIRTFATWNRSQLVNVNWEAPVLHFTLRRGGETLAVMLRQYTHGPLRAPVIGDMSRVIKESADSLISLEWQRNKSTAPVQLTGTHAGLEIIEEIFPLLET